MAADVYPVGGEMKAEFHGPSPRFDSPLMLAPMTDRNYVVMRMKYAGTSPTAGGSFYFRSGDVLPPVSYGLVRAIQSGV